MGGSAGVSGNAGGAGDESGAGGESGSGGSAGADTADGMGGSPGVGGGEGGNGGADASGGAGGEGEVVCAALAACSAEPLTSCVVDDYQLGVACSYTQVTCNDTVLVLITDEQEELVCEGTGIDTDCSEQVMAAANRCNPIIDGCNEPQDCDVYVGPCAACSVSDCVWDNPDNGCSTECFWRTAPGETFAYPCGSGSESNEAHAAAMSACSPLCD